MPYILIILLFLGGVCRAQVAPPAERQAPRGTQQTTPVPKPGQQPVPLPSGLAQPVPGVSMALTLASALERAQVYSQQVYTATFAAQLAHEDAVQARAGLLPSLNAFSQYIYTEPNGTPSGVFVSNDGPHVYNNQAIVHAEIYNPVKRADYRRALAAEVLARARADIAVRGLVGTVTQNYYGMVAAQRKLANAQQSLKEAQQVLDITQKQERGGEVAHADVIKAEIQVEMRQREGEDAQLALEKARLGFGVLLFPNYGQEFTLQDDLEAIRPLPAFAELQARAGSGNPEMRAAQGLVEQQTHALGSARAALLPSLSFDYFYGLNANQVAIYNPEHQRLLGSVAQAQLTIPIWTWGAARSKVRQAELQLQQARYDLSFTQRQLLSEINQFYAEAQVASSQTASLRHTVELSAESLRLTIERYQAGEATVLEVVDAQNTLVQARNAYDDGLVRYRVALANLQALTGVF